MSGSWRRTSQSDRHEQDDRGDVRRQRRLPRHDDHRGRDRGEAGLGEGRERQDEPGEEQTEERARRRARRRAGRRSRSTATATSWPVDSPSARRRANSPIRSLVEIVELTRKPMPANSIAASEPRPRIPIRPSGTGSVVSSRVSSARPMTLAVPAARAAERGQHRGLGPRLDATATTRRPAGSGRS